MTIIECKIILHNPIFSRKSKAFNIKQNFLLLGFVSNEYTCLPIYQKGDCVCLCLCQSFSLKRHALFDMIFSSIINVVVIKKYLFSILIFDISYIHHCYLQNILSHSFKFNYLLEGHMIYFQYFLYLATNNLNQILNMCLIIIIIVKMHQILKNFSILLMVELEVNRKNCSIIESYK